MNKTISELKQELKALQKENESLCYKYKSDSEYIKHAEACNDIQEKYRAKNRLIIEASRNRQAEIETWLRGLKEQKILKVSPKIKEWFDKLRRGVESYHWLIVHVSEDERFVVVKQPGKTGWSGVGLTSYYQTKYSFYDRMKCEGWSDYRHEHGGRLSKSEMNNILKGLLKK